jgi:hypothetical protein
VTSVRQPDRTYVHQSSPDAQAVRDDPANEVPEAAPLDRMTASQRGAGKTASAAEEGLEHEDPLGVGHPAVLVPPRDRIPDDPHRTPVPTLVRLRLGAGRTPALLMLVR